MKCENRTNTQVISKMLFDISRATIDLLTDTLFEEKKVSLSVLRLDKIHPVVSGNKLFKLHYFLQEALGSPHKTILTFGGAYSNHLSATAYACTAAGLKSIGIVRGEKPATLSHTLRQCISDGMELRFISRRQYYEKEEGTFTDSLKAEFGDCTIVPEGGYHHLGAKGAGLIMELVKDIHYSHICSALGTATTMAGLLLTAQPWQKIIGVPVLKGMVDIEERLFHLMECSPLPGNFEVFDQYHFGGYAGRTNDLIGFMNQYHLMHGLPLDFVYTAKLFYGIKDLIRKNHFPPGSNILCLHTGGLQGNLSLPPNTLTY